MTTTTLARPAWEVADIIRQHGDAFLTKYGGHLTAEQRQALRDLSRCRTAALGGHVERCADCGHERIAYNSCRNRHCPKCQALSRARWLEREAELLLPVEYHHVVFTLPQEIAELALPNRALLYDALFHAAADTLRDLAADPKWLGAHQGKLKFQGRLAHLANASAFARWLTPLYHKDWVVYAKPPFGGPEQVLKYLARYTHRVAISNHRLVSLENGQVTFRYKDYADDQRHKTMTLSAEEFLGRFLQHVLPRDQCPSVVLCLRVPNGSHRPPCAP